MSEKFITRERVFFSASALAAAGLGVVALKLIQRHREQGDDVTLEGAEQELAEQFEARTVPASDGAIESDVAYIGIEDKQRAVDASEVHAIGSQERFAQLRRLVANGSVYLHEKLKKADE